MSRLDPQWSADRNIVCFGDLRACSKDKLRFFYFSTCSLQLSIAADTQRWSPRLWDLFPRAGVEHRGEQGWCSCKCQRILLLLSPHQGGQSCVPSSPGTVLKIELQSSSWHFLWYLLWDLAGWNFQVRQTFVNSVCSAALAWESVRNVLPWLTAALPHLFPCSLSYVISRPCCHKPIGSANRDTWKLIYFFCFWRANLQLD